MKINEIYVSNDHYLLMFETKEAAEVAYMSGCQWAIKERKPEDDKKPQTLAQLKTSVWRNMIGGSPLSIENEVKHWCWHWSMVLDSKVTSIAPKEPILIVEEVNKEGLKPWKVIVGEKIGWIYCTHIIILSELKKE